jgi:glucose dehydrogenase
MRLALALAALVVASPVEAAERMTCDNGVTRYVARFDPVARRFFYDDQEYRVLAVESSTGSLVVSGLTLGNGPTFQAFFGNAPRVLYFEKSKLFETDRCR